MNPRKISQILALSLSAVLLATTCSLAGLYTKHKQHTDAHTIAGQSVPASDLVVEARLSGSKARIDQSNDTSVILDIEAKSMTILDHKGKTFAKLDIGQMQSQINSALEGSGMSQEQMQMMTGMMGNMMKMSATVTKTGETKKIGKWTCTKYDVTMQMGMAGTTNSEMWVSKTAQVKPKLYQDIKNFALLQLPGAESMFKELEKIDGVPVLVTSQSVVMGTKIKRKEELLAMKEMKIPASEFVVSKGYKRID